ncbi:hypothetical protein Tco_0098810 [Tanacetum coccineum]
MVIVEWKVRDYEDPIDEQEAYDVGVPDGGTKYQATGPFEDQCVVDIEEKKCSCHKLGALRKASNVGDLKVLMLGNLRCSKVGGSQAAKRARGSQTGASSAAKRSKLI